MSLHYNRISEKANRRNLRQEATPAEQILWQFLRNRKLSGIKFRRQYSVDVYIIDFYAPVYKLAVELDGEIHLDKDVIEHDRERDKHLKSFGIKILRIKNEVVINHIDKALELIKKNIEINKI